MTTTKRPRAYLERQPQVSELLELAEPTIKLELTEAELSLLLDMSADHIRALETKQGQLERSIEIYTQLGDLETIGRVRDRLYRITQLLEIDSRLDNKLYQASKS